MKTARWAISAVVLMAAGSSVLLAQRRAERPLRPMPPRGGHVMGDPEGRGLTFRLSEGAEETTPSEPLPTADARVLSDAETRKVLDRLPPLAGVESDRQDFALREKSLPPPRTGATVAAPFPPPESAERPDVSPAGPLQVLRHAPDGPIPLAPHLSVTFSQPMVAVTSHDALAQEAVPVRLSPQPAGRWRWVGTKTLLFEPDPRFPMATEYQAEVPAGTRSAVGGVTAAVERWTFTTATPTIVGSHPVGGPARRDTLMFVSFDQKIDPPAVLATIRVTAGGAAANLRLATPEEVSADDTVRVLAQTAPEGRWVAFRAAEPLAADAEVKVAVGPGTPSAEGPRRSEKPQPWTFRTYGPMRVTEHRCGWERSCPPHTPWNVVFSNPIDVKRFRKDMVRVEPALASLKVDVNGQWMNIRGASKARTTYRVTLSSALPDVFGQTLGQDVSLTFSVTAAEKTLFAPGGAMVVVDPTAGPRFSVYSTNHASLKVRAYVPAPSDWPAFQQYLQKVDRESGTPTAPPGRLAFTTDVAVKGTPDELTETRIDLARALPNGLGQVILIVEPSVAMAPKDRWRSRPVRTWVQVTRLGLTAFADETEVIAWASALQDGRPMAGVDVTLEPGDVRGKTDAAGLVTLSSRGGQTQVLVARQGNDVAILPANTSPYWYTPQPAEPAAASLRWFVFDDRHLYRPGEEVHLKGWIRQVDNREGGDVGPLSGAARKIAYRLQDAQNNVVAKGEHELSAMGAFDLALKLPATMNLGSAMLFLEAASAVRPGREHVHPIEVQEFRRPEFEVTTVATEGPYFIGAHAGVTVSASYFAGGALPNADVAWSVTSTPGSFTPPNRDDYTFGIWIPWWEAHVFPSEPTRTLTHASRTDGGGRHRLRVDFESVEPPRPSNVQAQATVTDVNRQAWTSTASLLVHPAEVYVGVRSDRLFVQKGEPLGLEAIVTDLDGEAVAGQPVTVRAERVDWENVDGEWKETTADPQDCAVTSAAEAVRCTFETKEGGTYRLTATVTDAKGRPNRTEIRRWVAGGKIPPKREVEQEKVTLIPGKKEYRAGETAEILVLAPFTPAEGVLTLRRSGIFRTERFRMTEASHTLRIALEEAWTPNVHVQVDLVGSAPRTDDAGEVDAKLPVRPAFAKGELNVEIPPHQRTLALEVKPHEKALAPGGKTLLDVVVRDAGGKPVAGSEVALVVVDEAVLSLTGHRIPDPIAVFYAQRDGGGFDRHLRESVLLGRPDELAPAPQGLERLQSLGYVGAAGGMALEMAAPAGPPASMPMARKMVRNEADGAKEPVPIQVRTDFSALALFNPGVTTDAAGRVQVPITLPDNLTRYRITAVAVTEGHHFGKGESTLTARLPLMVRPSPPRFLNFGDRIELPVVLQNQTDAAFDVDVALRAVNAEMTGGAGRRVKVPANDRVEVRFPVSAAFAGTARFQVGAISGTWSDAASFDLPVWTPATAEAFATYGQIDSGAVVQPVKAPAGVVPQFGGLEITTSSTALQALTDAVLYLVAYPYECSEQLASRVLAVAALKDVLTAFQAEGLPRPDEMVAAVDRDVKQLRQLQNEDGGFAFWRRGDESWPYIAIHVAHALWRAKEKGFPVPEDVLERSQGYLRAIERHASEKKYGIDTRRTLIAYALYVRHRMGDRDPGRARKLVQEAKLEGLSFEAIGWLLPVLSGDANSAAEVAAIRRHLANRASETASTAHFAVAYGDGAHLILHSDRRADAVLLEALIGDQPKSDLIPKLVEGLLGHRKQGRWSNTQENAFVLLALDRYFNTYEKTTPDFVARAWLGDAYAGEHAFRGRTTERHHIGVPMRLVAEGSATKELVLAKQGAGRLYYRIGLQYAPASLTLAPADHGFTVERVYEGVDRREDVTRGADGTWRIASGARVRVKLTMVAPSPRYHVALVDPLPAGLEALNPALATTETLPPSGETDTIDVVGAPGLGGPRHPGFWWWWRRTWYDHQNLRDERVEAFASLLWEGVHSYSYVARATTPGAFVVPPPKAEEMYHPETFGRGATDRIIVE
jgi:alpha-2-macroglobulin